MREKGLKREAEELKERYERTGVTQEKDRVRSAHHCEIQILLISSRYKGTRSRGINTTVSMKDLGDLVAYYT